VKTKVIWTDREWKQLAQWFIDSGVDIEQYGFSGVVNRAQTAVLPADRHRAVKGVPAALKKEIKQHIFELGVQKRPKDPVTFVPEPPTAAQLSTEDLLVELARRVAKIVDTLVLLGQPQVMISPPVDRGFHPRHNPTPVESAKLKRPRILVVGPKGHQQETLRGRFPSLDLRFVTCEDNPTRCAAGILDEAILWTKFMNHAQQDTIKTLGYATWYANTLDEIEARLKKWCS